MDRLDSLGWYSLAVVRNPYDRVVSAFVDKFCTAEVGAGWVQGAIRAAREDARKGLSLSFEQFVRYITSVPDELCDRHWRSQTFTLAGRKLSKLVRVEELERDMIEVSRALSLATSPALRRDQARVYRHVSGDSGSFSGVSNYEIMMFREAHRTYPSKEAFWTAELKELVAARFASDFLSLGYET
jgi:hypothetical protein